ncbi:NAD(P)-binding domain-containing protein (plasmid) [Enterobacter sp. JBIWA008]|uniref:NADPH-dependent F420 reductase n=1 Tax=Enterobacter sp. JBIWA008 TaxID=2831892 RepID=UPI001CBCA1F6|nr:NAD(P)-binding domain-containing protein [Enterobacter sp. JBIWA008]UAN43322.1 NAD(P)-binding domain-containing protein [Enterobacter sp. JBIWA008]
MKVAIFGTGNVGIHMNNLLTGAGYETMLCGRRTADENRHTFAEGASGAEAILIALPYTVAVDIMKSIAPLTAGKLVIDCTNPLNPDWSPLVPGENRSAGEVLAGLLPDARLVKAFNTVFADVMVPERQLRSGLKITAFVAGDDTEARQKVITLASDIGFEPLDTGALFTARYLEAMAHLNIHIAVAGGGGTHAAFIYHKNQ